jgi:hypothetical protein
VGSKMPADGGSEVDAVFTEDVRIDSNFLQFCKGFPFVTAISYGIHELTNLTVVTVTC